MAGAEAGLDAFITFEDGMIGDELYMQVEGETSDVFETKYASSQIKSYNFSFSLNQDWANEYANFNRGENDDLDRERDSATRQFVHDPEFDTVKIDKGIDLASPSIFRAMCHGVIFEQVFIWQKRSGASKERSGDYFWMIRMDKVIITRLSWSASDSLPTESFELKFREIRVEYVPQKSTGALDKGKAQKSGYSLLGPRDKKDAKSGEVDKAAIVKEVLDQVKQALKKSGVTLK
jgi:type VI protein secretion system component Hcp